jgi:hypothetical protein
MAARGGVGEGSRSTGPLGIGSEKGRTSSRVPSGGEGGGADCGGAAAHAGRCCGGGLACRGGGGGGSRLLAIRAVGAAAAFDIPAG